MISPMEYPPLQKMERSTRLSLGILICTYNPDERIFWRTLKSVEALILPDDILIECVIVDNNSPSPVEQLPYVQTFLEKCPWARVIREPQQGVAFARITGMAQMPSSAIVFIDTDNEVAPNYLQVAADFLKQYPHIAAVGPGNVTVDFLDTVSEWFANSFRASMFQEKHVDTVEYACIPATWLNCYPIGTGLVLRKAVFDAYHQAFQQGQFTATGRLGQSLASGEDIQMIWQAIKMGYAVGICPDLKVTHLIPASRSNLDYVKRLCFGSASSYPPCLVGSFPEMKSSIVNSMPTTASILQTLLKKTIKGSIELKFSSLLIDLAGYLGDLSGKYQAIQRNNQILNFMIKQLKLR
jgi:glycosyltransferase involved in cell wall biosynthesis